MSLDKERINVGLIGCGVVGGPVAKGLLEGRLAEQRVFLKTIVVRDTSKPREGINFSNITDDPNAVLEDPEIDIVVEVMGGLDPARSYNMRALDAGKQLVTANKQLLGEDLPDLYDLAREKGVSISYEASVCGTIPIIRTLREYYIPQTIKGVSGIVNGTCNYILTRMAEGLDFDSALREAQELGYAEANPRNDLDGSDSCSKLALLASNITKVHIKPSQILKRGIYGVTLDDILYADRLGYTVKLLASAEQYNGTWSIQVAPALVRKTNPLASVNGSFNAISVESDLSDIITFEGRGAGGDPTAAAVLADTAHAAEHARYGIPDQLPKLARHVALTNPQDVMSRGYIRVWLLDELGTYARIGQIMRDCKLSMKSILQEGEESKIINGREYTQDFITLHQTPEARIQEGLRHLGRSHKVYGKPFHMRFAA